MMTRKRLPIRKINRIDWEAHGGSYSTLMDFQFNLVLFGSARDGVRLKSSGSPSLPPAVGCRAPRTEDFSENLLRNGRHCRHLHWLSNWHCRVYAGGRKRSRATLRGPVVSPRPRQTLPRQVVTMARRIQGRSMGSNTTKSARSQPRKTSSIVITRICTQHCRQHQRP